MPLGFHAWVKGNLSALRMCLVCPMTHNPAVLHCGGTLLQVSGELVVVNGWLLLSSLVTLLHVVG